MNCRKVSGFLSAYLDQELTGEEMLAVRAHLGDCSLCRSEYQSLSDTKRLLASLALQTPRSELEQLLLCDAERSGRPWTARLIPEWLRDWVSVSRADGEDTAAVAVRNARPLGDVPGLRLRPLAATALLSLAGLCLATAKLNGPHEESSQGMSPEVYAGYTNFQVISPARPVAVSDTNDIPLLPATVPVRGVASVPWGASVFPSSSGPGSPALLLSPQLPSQRWGTASASYGGASMSGAFQLASHR